MPLVPAEPPVPAVDPAHPAMATARARTDRPVDCATRRTCDRCMGAPRGSGVALYSPAGNPILHAFRGGLVSSGIPGSNRRHSAWECAPGASAGVARGSSPSQASDFVRGGISGEVHAVPPVAPLRQVFAAPLLQGSRFGVVEGGGGAGALLTV